MIGSFHGNIYNALPTSKRYGKAIAFCQGSVKAAIYRPLRITVYGIGNACNSRSNTGGVRILYSHIDRRNSIFLIIILRQFLSRFRICRVLHIRRRKGDLRRVILHNHAVCCAFNALGVRDISRCIRTFNIGDAALPVCGKGNFRHSLLNPCSRILCRAGRRRYGIRNLLCPAAIFRHRNTQDQAFSTDDPFKNICCLLLEGNLTDIRPCLIPLHGDRSGYGFLAHCVHRLEGVGMHALYAIVSFRKCCT